ncbi:MAG: hypothetical protein NC913_09685 [Candidatus Omnitrophica bacterium]|nr:hypothetical protein [Candidatus Omnitrophota bacterium]
MGTKYQFTCRQCGYTEVVSGGKDCGMFAVVKTFNCYNCMKTVDVFVGVFGKEYKDIANLKKAMGTTKEIIKDFRKCPECLKSDCLVEWNSKRRPCPKCGGKMQKGKEILLWD